MNILILSSLESVISSGEPLPLSWVVANGDAFPSAWATSDDPHQMLRIVAGIVPRQQLVIIACAVARTTLKFVPRSELRPLRAIETAEAWARGMATVEEVRRAGGEAYAASFPTNSSAPYSYTAAAIAARAAAYAAATVRDPVRAPYAADADAAAAAAAASAGNAVRAVANRKSAQVIRKHVHITVADLVRAGKSGWNP